MSRVDDACAVSARLRSIGAHRGAAQVAFNALLMAKAEADARRARWTPDGPLPLPANDRTEVSIARP